MSGRNRFNPTDLLDWYDRHHRSLPWRISPADRAAGASPDPYRVWLSEIMLQQTTVAAVGPYFTDFLSRWPTVSDLAAAHVDDVMAAWAGLGYYSRARNLKKCADIVASEHKGRFPDSEAVLRDLPGIGPYTAAAIAAIAFDRPATVVDGNVERVVSRLFKVETPLPGAKPELRHLAETLTPTIRPGDFAQAMMDLGATICTPRSPACALCPVNAHCSAFASDRPERFPVKGAKKKKPRRSGAAFVAIRSDGAVLLRRRPPKGLLGGMAEVPGTDWSEALSADIFSAAPFTADWKKSRETVTHVFTHFRLELDIYRADVGDVAAPEGCWWSPAEGVAGEALPTVMRKAIAAGLGRPIAKRRR